jgi:acyl-coenzyme A thioesterase PaaI-like protein
MDFRKRVTPNNAKWLLKFYPPFLFNRISILDVSEDFTEVNVKIKRSLFNMNLAKTMFGGSMFSAADPFIAIMFWQIFAIRFNQEIIVWLKSAEIIYKKPAETSLFINFKISEGEIVEAKKFLEEKGRFVAEHEVSLKNTIGEVCAIVKLMSYLGNKES